MKTEFTKGEWKAKLISTGEKPAHPVYWSIIFEDGYDPNRAAIDVYKGSKSTLKEAEANAKLIAASPDLLKALQEVEGDVKDWAEYNEMQADSFEDNERQMQLDIAANIKNRLAQLKAAIQKATESRNSKGHLLTFSPMTHALLSLTPLIK